MADRSVTVRGWSRGMTAATASRRWLVALEVGGLLVVAALVLAGLGKLLPASIAVAAPRDLVVVILGLWTAGASYLGVTISAVSDERMGARLGLANALTIVRGGLYAVVAAFVLVPPTGWLVWIPAFCYGTGVMLDWVDGSVARTVGRETTLGRRLDMAFDTFGFVAAPLVAVAWGQLPVWYLSLSAARYVYRAAKYQRRLRGLPLYDRPDNDFGRYLAAGQMVFITLVLTPIVSPGLVATVAPVALAPSLGVFVRDYLFISGRLPAGRRRSASRAADDR